VYLRGYESARTNDVKEIAEGRAKWDNSTGTYEINDRRYEIKPSGTAFPISGKGLIKLDRDEYKALKLLAQNGGDPSRVAQFKYDPALLKNPQAITKAKSIWDGTYQ
jgi:hypothetical protein